MNLHAKGMEFDAQVGQPYIYYFTFLIKSLIAMPMWIEN